MGFDVICNGNRECAELIQAKRDALKAENERMKAQLRQASDNLMGQSQVHQVEKQRLQQENAALLERLERATILLEIAMGGNVSQEDAEDMVDFVSGVDIENEEAQREENSGD